MVKALAVFLSVLALAGCGGSSSSEEMVWCVGPGEQVDAAFRAEYPELEMTKAECDAATAMLEQVVQP